MKLQVRSDKLLEALSKLKKVFNQPSLHPLYRSVLLEYKDGDVIVKACDGAVWAATKCSVESTESFECLIPGDKLYDTVKSAPKDTVIIITVENWIATLRYKRTKVTITGVDPYEFQSQPRWPVSEWHSLSRLLVSMATNAGGYAASELPPLYHVYLERSNNTMFASSTDGMRLASAGVPSPGRDFKLVLNPRTLKAIKDLDGVFMVAQTDTHTWIHEPSEDELVIAVPRSANDEWRDLRQIVAQHESAFGITVDSTEFCSAIEVAGKVTTESARDGSDAVYKTIVLSVEGATLSVQSENSDVATAAVDIDTTGCGAAWLGIQSRMLLDAVEGFRKSAEIELRFPKEERLGLMLMQRPFIDEPRFADCVFYALIMPMKPELVKRLSKEAA